MTRREDGGATEDLAPDPDPDDVGTERVRPAPRPTQPLAEPTSCDGDTTLPPRFESRGVIGRGGMGRVLRVFDRSLDREVAIKLILSARLGDARARLRSLREARAAGTLRHPNIVTVYDVAPDGEYLVMELIEGESLASLIRREGRLPVDDVRRIGGELLAALDAAHRRGIIHRDIKPANILLDQSGTVKLTDFGIASFGDAELTSTGQLVGTPAYMAPEQLRGRRVDARADIYGVGATLFELATGIRLNNKAEQVADPRQVVLDATGDQALAAAIGQAICEKEKDRIPDAATFAAALVVTRPPRPRRRLRAWHLAVAVAAVVAGGIVAATAMRGRDGSSPAAAEQRVITVAILPFENHLADERLDFASSGLAHLLGERLERVGQLRVLGHYRVRERLAGPESPSAWLAAARALGAQLVVRGEIESFANHARVTLVVERIDGSQLERFEREAAIDQIPEVVQALAPSVAGAVIGARQEIPSAPNRALDVERELQLGIAAFERQDFESARQHLDAAIGRDDNLAEAHYYLALLDWWQSEVSTAHLDRALAGSLRELDKDFLAGLRMLVEMDYPRAVDYFRALARRAPDHREIQYGLFEALFHGGYPAEAIDTYRRLRELAPSFYVGAEHAMVYYLARGDAAGIEWVRKHWEISGDGRALWAARIAMAQQAYPEATRALERAAEEPGTHDAIERELVAAYAVSGQLELARATAARIAEARGYRALADYGLAIASGEDARGARTRAKQAVAYGISGYKPWEGWLDLVALDLTDGAATVLREDLTRRTAKDRNLTIDIGALILDAALRDTAEITAAATSHFPQEVAVARALAAEAAADPRTAATAWRTVADLDGDGRIRLLAWFALARDLRAQADHAAVIGACDEVITPRVFTWAWAAEVGPCVRWSAEAATALGRRDEARQRWRRLITLRSAAPDDDELVRAARAALAK